MSLDVLETRAGIEVVVDLVGVPPDAVQIVVARNTLLITGTKQPAACEHHGEATFHVAERVFVVHRRAKFRGAPESVMRLQKLADEGRLELLIPYQLFGLDGADGELDSVTLADLDGHTKQVPADALLAFFGLAMDLGPIASWGSR